MAKKFRLERLSINSFCTGNGGSFGKVMSNIPQAQGNKLGPDTDNTTGPILPLESGPFCGILPHDPTTINPINPTIFTLGGPITYMLINPLNKVDEIDPIFKPFSVDNNHCYSDYCQTVGAKMCYTEPVDICTANPLDDPNLWANAGGTEEDPDPITPDSDMCESVFYACQTDGCTDTPDPDSYVICASDWGDCEQDPPSPSNA